MNTFRKQIWKQRFNRQINNETNDYESEKRFTYILKEKKNEKNIPK